MFGSGNVSNSFFFLLFKHKFEARKNANSRQIEYMQPHLEHKILNETINWLFSFFKLIYNKTNKVINLKVLFRLLLIHTFFDFPLEQIFRSNLLCYWLC